MLKNSFCHVPGIGAVYERRLWSLGVNSWDKVLNGYSSTLTGRRFSSLSRHIERSFHELESQNAPFFAKSMPSDEHWRMFPEFRDSIAYLDIETTGLRAGGNTITCISVYDGREIRCYVRGRNLDEFKGDIAKYKLLVTYNGKCFDVPVIEQNLRVRFDVTHIDLRYVLTSLGYMGGLKMCEKQFGIDRGSLDGVDGYYAVLLWNEYVKSGNEHALETLMAYNIEDV
ncbi:MAG: ribonuclease H-like domain-containing protein, partial [Candidatus Krumholzibacteria bacterium]|nr:ribonuclease H-like domain-containing protein [Candidatus Krumholzibacteria bacterium]